MAQFTVRVELHGAESDDYNRLHAVMKASGFLQFVPGMDASGNHGWFQLPTAEYDYSSENENSAQVRDKAKILADSVKAGSWVLVTKVASRSWSTKKVAAPQ